MSALAFAFALAGDVPHEEVERIPGARPLVGIVDVALDGEVGRLLKLTEEARAQLGLLRDELAAQRNEAARDLEGNSWSLLAETARRRREPRLTPQHAVKELREIVGADAFGQLRSLYAAVRGPSLVLDYEFFRRVDQEDTRRRFKDATRGLDRTPDPGAPPRDERAFRRQVRLELERSLKSAEKSLLARLREGDRWPAPLVERLAELPCRCGPTPWYTPGFDWASSWDWLPTFLTDPGVRAALALDAGQAEALDRLWADAHEAERWYFEAFCMAPAERHPGMRQHWDRRHEATVLELQQRMLAALRPAQAEMAWSIHARVATLANVFHGAVRVELGLTRAQSDAYGTALFDEGLTTRRPGAPPIVAVPFGEASMKAARERSEVEKSRRERLKKEGPERKARVQRQLLERIFTLAQRAQWERWSQLEIPNAPALRPCQPPKPPRNMTPGLDVGSGIDWD